MRSDFFDLLFFDGRAVEQHFYSIAVLVPQEPKPGCVFWCLATGLCDCLRSSPLLLSS